MSRWGNLSEHKGVNLSEQRRPDRGRIGGHPVPEVLHVFQAARAGDVATRTMLSERARYMGIALANLVNTFNPELIVLGGILAQGEDLLLPVMKATMRF